MPTIIQRANVYNIKTYGKYTRHNCPQYLQSTLNSYKLHETAVCSLHIPASYKKTGSNGTTAFVI